MPVCLWQNDQSRLVSIMILTDCPDEPMPAITAREVFQVLHDAIFGRRAMVRVCARTWDEVYPGMLMVDIGDGALRSSTTVMRSITVNTASVLMDGDGHLTQGIILEETLLRCSALGNTRLWSECRKPSSRTLKVCLCKPGYR
jgi:hypothetical protein